MMIRAIVRPPGRNFAEGLTTSGLGPPDLSRALEQHRAYREALRRCGLDVVEMPPDEAYPDSTFVEDAAVLTSRGAMITRPGAASRAGEVVSIRAALRPYFPDPDSIRSPGTLDGGDVCEADGTFFIGLSERTNEAGAGQLAEWLAKAGFQARLVDIRGTAGLLHLKSGLAALGDGRLAVTAALSGRSELAGFETLRIPAGEEYAANCLRIGGTLFLASGYPRTTSFFRPVAGRLIELDVSEFRKMDGGLSCLSLRF
jgi:dimethylargininase